jgi:hypothetical protein
MVRYHILNSGQWDVATYGIPIPQADQMPAGLIGVFLMSAQLLRKGQTDFTPEQRASVELSRYRCFLLGLPEDLLGETPQEIVDLLIARHVSLRRGLRRRDMRCARRAAPWTPTCSTHPQSRVGCTHG